MARGKLVKKYLEEKVAYISVNTQVLCNYSETHKT